MLLSENLYLSKYLLMLPFLVGIRELFSQTDEICTKPRIPIMVSVTSISSSSKKVQKTQEISIQPGQSLDQVFTENRHPVILDDDSDDDDDNQLPETEEEVVTIFSPCVFLFHFR